MKNIGKGLVGSVIVTKYGDETTYHIKPSRKAALKGAGVGMFIGRAFGPGGIAAGALIGGTIGYVFGDDDDL